MPEHSPITPREKACQLLRYLKAFVSLRSSVVRNVENYAKDGAVIWFHEMPHERDCASAMWGDGEEDQPDVWLRVRHQVLPSAPDAPAELEPWIDSRELRRSDARSDPQLKPVAFRQLPASEDQPASIEELHLEDHLEVTDMWNRFLPKWRAWAEDHRRKSAIQAVYARLFSAYQRHAKLGELYELILGIGLLHWHPASGESIKRHCITLNVELDFDRLRGEIRMRCAAGGARPRLEDEMLEADQRPVRKDYDVVESHIAAVDSNAWPGDLLAQSLKSWVHSLDSAGGFHEGPVPVTANGRAPQISFAPALILRKRSAAPTLRVYSQILDQLAVEGAKPTFGLHRLVEDIDDEDLDETVNEQPSESRPHGRGPLRTYFPLPANSQQREIIERLSRRRGVLVQGPPGTGKSHTIANLICHLLAEGKRVLVTSETARALRVLKGKIPEQLRDLCVSNLGGDLDSFRELESTIGGITRRQANFDRASYEARVAEFESSLDELHRLLAGLDRQLRDLRKSETEIVRLTNGSFVGTPSELAQQLSHDRAALEWCQLEDMAPDAPPLTDAEFEQFVAGLRQFPTELRLKLEKSLPCHTALPPPHEFASLVTALENARTAFAAHAQITKNPRFASLVGIPRSVRDDWEKRLTAAEHERGGIFRLENPWVERALRDSLSGRVTLWRELESQTQRLLAGIRDQAVDLEATQLALPPDVLADKIISDATEMAKILREGGGWGLFGLKVGRTAAYFYLRRSCQIGGKAAESAATLDKLAQHLTLRRNLETTWKLWADYEKQPNSTILAQVTYLEDANRNLRHLLRLAETYSEMGVEMTSRQISRPDWLSNGAAECIALLQAARSSEAVSAAEQALGAVHNCVLSYATADAHPVVSYMIDAVATRSIEAWSDSILRMRTLSEQKQQLSYYQQLEGKLRSASRRTYEAVSLSIGDPVWDTRSHRFSEAWRWSRLSRWLQKYRDADTVAQLEKQRSRTENDILRVTADLAAQKAWLAFLGRLKPEESNTLKSWRAAVRGIGKGQGKSAKIEHLRQRAREMATKAASAVPAWIMPRYKVAEMLEPHPETFDVVIVDEASQSGIESLFLFHIAKKIIVVGDIQQISPSSGFIDTERVLALQRLYLDGLPHDVVLRPENSLYENAQIRFNGNIVLREHFRCMPEIIQFSNDLCYAPHGTPLDPLRNYRGSRLPPLKTHLVSTGYRTGSSSTTINVPEAEALVDAIEACVRDPRYAKKSMGVISLQGEAQAQKIQQLLLERIGPAEMEKRDLVCGDAYAFQGDERDVMFLSLVAATNERIGVLSKASDHQRFNVAASRARDQMWIFHSVQPEDLSRECVRYRLLSYMLNPQRNQQSQGEIRFESKFEEDVYHELTSRGFAVRTQVGVGDTETHRYRIDLVVEGMRSRLAVECDGDRWHGPDRYEADMRRQRDLERMGWRFGRLRGSAFYSDRVASMASIIEILKELGIGTIPEEAARAAEFDAEDTAPQTDEDQHKSEWSPAFETRDDDEGSIDDLDGSTDQAGQSDVDIVSSSDDATRAFEEAEEQTTSPQSELPFTPEARPKIIDEPVSPKRSIAAAGPSQPLERPVRRVQAEHPHRPAASNPTKRVPFSKRPYATKSVADMETIINGECDSSVINEIDSELALRTTDAAARLLERIKNGLRSGGTGTHSPNPTPRSAPQTRPFFNKSTTELQTLSQGEIDLDALKMIAHELTFRGTEAARRLAAAVAKKLSYEP